MTRFPSDLLETSVDPDNDIKDIPSSDIPPSTEIKSFKPTLSQNKYETQQDSKRENSLRTIECAKNNARLHEVDLTLQHKHQRNPLLSTSSLLNQMHPEDQLINLEKVLDSKTFHITTSTLETANSTEITSSLEISKEKEDQLCEVGNNTNRTAISFSEEFDSNVEAEMVRIYNAPPTTASAAQSQYQVGGRPSDSTSNVNQVSSNERGQEWPSVLLNPYWNFQFPGVKFILI